MPMLSVLLLLKNVAIDVNHMFAHTNPIFSDRPDVSFFGDDVPN